MGQLEIGTGIHYKPLPFLNNSNTTGPIKKGIRCSGFLTTKEKSYKNVSTTLLNIDNITLYTEFNPCGFIDMPVIEIILNNDYIHILPDFPKG